MKILQQSTAYNLKMGQFVSSADGVTAYTTVIPAANIKVSKTDGALAASHSATASTHDADGFHIIPIDTTDTGTAGRLKVSVGVSGSCLWVWEDFYIVPAVVWNALIANSGNGLLANLTTIVADTTSPSNLKFALNSEQQFTLTGSPTSTTFAVTGFAGRANMYINRYGRVTAGTRAGEEFQVQSNDGSGNFTITALTGAPASSDTVIIV